MEMRKHRPGRIGQSQLLIPFFIVDSNIPIF
jgi:hypothetical protein